MSLKYEVVRYKYCVAYKRHGLYHRMNGPALFWTAGRGELYRYGIKLGVCRLANRMT
jgi:hypothetical protein